MSVQRLTALSVYATVFTWSVWRSGFPVDRPVVVAWLLGAVVLAWGGRQPGMVGRAFADWLPIVLVMLAYDLSRGAADGLGMPIQVRLPIVVDESVFGTVPTVWLQQHLGPFGAHVHWWEIVISLVYISHFILPFALGVWLWARNRVRFAWWRDRFLTLTAMGLVTYVLLPTSPPWLAARDGELPAVARTAGRGWSRLGIGVADRLFDLGRAAFNPSAALPSLHAAFAAFVVVTVWRQAPRWTKPLLVAYPLAMALALVVSGEHYVFDIAAGFVYVAVTVLVWRRIDVRLGPWRERVAQQRAGQAVLDTHVDSVPSAPPALPPSRRLPRSMWTLSIAATVLALATRAIRLGHPNVMVFDEAFYSIQALEVAQYGVERGHSVHPPGAKWVIAAGIRLFGFNPIGWRIAPLIAGALVVGLTVVAAYRATTSLRMSALAGLLVLTDGIAVVTGRLALLDGIVALWTTAALAILVALAAHPLDVATVRRALWPLGVLFGLAIATKWSAAPVWLASVAFVMWLLRQSHSPVRRPVTILIGLPLVVYAATFIPTLANYHDSATARVACADHVTCADGPIDRIEAIVHDHAEVWRYHTNLDPTNQYAVSSWNWIAQTQPTLLYQRGDQSMQARANPAVWLAGTVALVWCGWFARIRRRPVHGLLAVTAACWWVPWAIGQRPGYSFYAAPLAPVVAIGIVMAIVQLPPRWGRATFVVTAVTALGGAAVMAPRWFAL